jgi:hypothetical protein
MSDSESDEEQYTEENVVLETPEPVKKKRAPRKLSEEQKARALENLRKGREKANAIRKAKKEGREYVEPKPQVAEPKTEPKKKTKKVVEEDEEEETTIIQQKPKKKKKQRKIILQTESDSESDEDCIVIKTKSKKKKPVEKVVEETPKKPLEKPQLVRTPNPIQEYIETPYQKQQRMKMEQIHKNAEMMMTQFN